MKIPRQLRIVAVGLLALASICLITGCGDNASNPVTPGGTGNEPGALQYVLDNYGDPFSLADSSGGQGKLIGSIVVDGDAVLVGRDGGDIELQLGGKTSTLDIPSGALSHNVLITALAVQITTPLGDVTVYDFGPDGLVFNRPAELELWTNCPKGKVLSLFWFNPLTELWEVQQRHVVESGGRIRFTVSHFSKYGIS